MLDLNGRLKKVGGNIYLSYPGSLQWNRVMQSLITYFQLANSTVTDNNSTNANNTEAHKHKNSPVPLRTYKMKL